MEYVNKEIIIIYRQLKLINIFQASCYLLLLLLLLLVLLLLLIYFFIFVILATRDD